MKRREFFGVLGGAVVLPACVALVAVVIVFMAPNAKAQEAEPRSYSNTPVGLNFLIAGYLYTQGKIAFDPELSVADAKFHSHTGALAYVRTLDVFGKSAKFDVILPIRPFPRRLSWMASPEIARCRDWETHDFVFQ